MAKNVKSEIKKETDIWERLEDAVAKVCMDYDIWILDTFTGPIFSKEFEDKVSSRFTASAKKSKKIRKEDCWPVANKLGHIEHTASASNSLYYECAKARMILTDEEYQTIQSSNDEIMTHIDVISPILSNVYDILYQANLEYERGQRMPKSVRKSKVKKSISQDMEMYGGQINVSAGPGRGSQNWDFMDYCMELEEAEDESALDDLCEKIDRGETSFCIHRNDGWDYDIMVIKSTKKSIPADIDSQLDSMLEELADACYNLDEQWVNTATDAQYELGYRAYDDVRADVKRILDGSNEGKIISLCEDILQRMDSLGKTKKSIPKSKDTKMSFEQNVNKIRQSNYDRIGNINKTMRERK